MTQQEPINRNKVKSGLAIRLKGKKIEKNVDLLIALNFAIFMDRLAQKTEKEPVNKNQIGTEYRVRKENIDKCLENVLREFRG